jgi:hypothetical protein
MKQIIINKINKKSLKKIRLTFKMISKSNKIMSMKIIQTQKIIPKLVIKKF